MSLALFATRRGTQPWFRVITAALLALQVAIACSPLLERQAPPPGVAHVHDQERRHAPAHDESTCAVCTARQHVAQAAPAAVTVPIVDRKPQTARAAGQSLTSVAPRELHLSRAPPVTA